MAEMRRAGRRRRRKREAAAAGECAYRLLLLQGSAPAASCRCRGVSLPQISVTAAVPAADLTRRRRRCREQRRVCPTARGERENEMMRVYLAPPDLDRFSPPAISARIPPAPLPTPRLRFPPHSAWLAGNGRFERSQRARLRGALRSVQMRVRPACR